MRGRQLFKEYWNRPEATAADLSPDKWFRCFPSSPVRPLAPMLACTLLMQQALCWHRLPNQQGRRQPACALGALLQAGLGCTSMWGQHPFTDSTICGATTASVLCRTGDIAEVSGDPPYFTLLGRASADIIKASGYKISALGIENVIAAHPQVREVAVLGLPHSTLGEEITAVVACHEPHQVDKYSAALLVDAVTMHVATGCLLRMPQHWGC